MRASFPKSSNTVLFVRGFRWSAQAIRFSSSRTCSHDVNFRLNLGHILINSPIALIHTVADLHREQTRANALHYHHVFTIIFVFNPCIPCQLSSTNIVPFDWHGSCFTTYSQYPHLSVTIYCALDKPRVFSIVKSHPKVYNKSSHINECITHASQFRYLRHLCCVLCSFQPSFKHCASQKKARPLQVPGGMFQLSPNLKTMILTTAFFPWACTSTGKTPLPRACFRCPCLFVQINSFEIATWLIQTKLPHIGETPRNSWFARLYVVRGGIASKQ